MVTAAESPGISFDKTIIFLLNPFWDNVCNLKPKEKGFIYHKPGTNHNVLDMFTKQVAWHLKITMGPGPRAVTYCNHSFYFPTFNMSWLIL